MVLYSFELHATASLVSSACARMSAVADGIAWMKMSADAFSSVV